MSANASERWRDDTITLRRICFDSNALIYALEERQPYGGYVNQLLDMLQTSDAIGFISTLTEMEMLVQPIQDRDSVAIDRIEAFLRGMPNLFVRSVDRGIAREAATLRARTRLAPVNSVIAATALLERCDAIIGNDSLFANRVREEGILYLHLDDYLT